jgi:aromatic-L-amino-acid/L-tryptophan decarboxylase
VLPEQRGWLAGVERADSFAFNPHKWLLTNFDCDAFFTRDREALREAMSVTPEYLRNAASASGQVIDYRDWQVPLGRRFRALKLWFVLRHYGAEGLRAHIREHLRLGELFERLVREDARFELAAPRSLSLVCFRLAPRAGETPEACDARNRQLLERLNAGGRAFLTHTVLPHPDRYVLRMAIGAPTTQERHVRAAWAELQSLA